MVCLYDQFESAYIDSTIFRFLKLLNIDLESVFLSSQKGTLPVTSIDFICVSLYDKHN